MDLITGLENLYLAGSETVEAKVVLGKTQVLKKDKELLADWIGQGYVEEKQQGKKKLYRLTALGQEKLHEDEARWQRIEQEKKRQQHARMQSLLECVQSKTGKKALTQAEQKKYLNEIAIACEQKLVEPLTVKNKYLLTEAGRAWLLAARPPDKILAEMEEKIASVAAAAKETRQAELMFFQNSFPDQPGLPGLWRDHLGKLEDHFTAALKEIDQMRDFFASLEASRQVQEKFETKLTVIESEFTSRFETTSIAMENMHNDWVAEQQNNRQKQREQIDDRCRKIEDRLSNLQSLYHQVQQILEPSPQPRAAQALQVKSPSDSGDLVYSIYLECCREMDQQMVPIDMIYRQVQSRVKMAQNEFQQVLLELEKKKRIELHTDTGLASLEDAAQAIRTQRGPLSYVAPFKHDPHQLVYQLARELVHHENMVSLPRLLRKAREVVPLTMSEFESIIRELASRMSMGRASSQDDKGGVYVNGVYYYYITEVV